MNQHISWLTSDLLVIFIDELRTEGYNIGVEQYIAAHDLLLALAAGGEDINDPRRLKSLFGPVLCSTPAEQEDFGTRFDRWVAQVAPMPSPTSPTGTGALTQELDTLKRRRWQVWALAIGVPLLLVWVGLLLSQGNTPGVQPTSTALDLPWEWGLALLGALLLGLALWRLWWFYRAHLFLIRRATDRQPDLDSITVRGVEEEVFPTLLFVRIAQRFRRRVSIPSDELAVTPTLSRTIANGGWFTPVYAQRLVLPEYLVLVDRAHYNDHQARLVETMLNQLVQNEVFVTGYTFDGDPRVCTPIGGDGQPLLLGEIGARYPHHRLILFSNAEGLLSPRTGALEPWTDLFATWKERAVLTPEPAALWGYREQTLAQYFTVLPLSAEGLLAFSQSLESAVPAAAQSESDAAPLPIDLRLHAERWSDREPPLPDQVNRVLSALRRHLGDAGYLWFSACAVYPELHWELTLYLGYTLHDIEDRPLLQARRLLELARLPWFRNGVIPDWLRVRLIGDLPRAQERTIRAALRALLVTAAREEPEISGLRLEIARERDPVVGPLAYALLRLLVRRTPVSSPLRDHVFVRFMTGRSQKHLGVHLPETLCKLLRPTALTYIIVAVVSAVLGAVASLIPSLPFSGWFIFLVSPLAGTIIAEVVSRLTRRRYNRHLRKVVVVAVVLGSLPMLLPYAFGSIVVFKSGSAWGILYMFFALIHLPLVIGAIILRLPRQPEKAAQSLATSALPIRDARWIRELITGMLMAIICALAVQLMSYGVSNGIGEYIGLSLGALIAGGIGWFAGDAIYQSRRPFSLDDATVAAPWIGRPTTRLVMSTRRLMRKLSLAQQVGVVIVLAVVAITVGWVLAPLVLQAGFLWSYFPSYAIAGPLAYAALGRRPDRALVTNVLVVTLGGLALTGSIGFGSDLPDLLLSALVGGLSMEGVGFLSNKYFLKHLETPVVTDDEIAFRFGATIFGLGLIGAITVHMVIADWILAWLVALNIITFLTLSYDKSIVGSETMRVPERVLLWLAVAGGTLGAFTAMRLFRHKLAKKNFRLQIAFIGVVQIVLLVSYYVLRP